MVKSLYFNEDAEKKNSFSAGVILFLILFLLFAGLIVGINTLGNHLEYSEDHSMIKDALSDHSFGKLSKPYPTTKYGSNYEVETKWFQFNKKGKKYQDAVLYVKVYGNDKGLVECKNCF